MSCDVGCRLGSDLALLWLWYRLEATALIRPLAWKPPYAMCAALERPKKKKKFFYYEVCFYEERYTNYNVWFDGFSQSEHTCVKPSGQTKSLLLAPLTSPHYVPSQPLPHHHLEVTTTQTSNSLR